METTTKTNKRVFLASNEWCGVYDHEDYVEFCEMNNIEAKGEGSHEFTEWCVSEAQMAFEDDLNIVKRYSEKKFKDKNPQFFITARLGLWERTHERHCRKVYNNLYEAILCCISNSDYTEVKVEYDKEDGTVVCTCHHHDGTNIYTIHLLSRKGEKYIEGFFNSWGGKLNFKREYWKKMNIGDIWTVAAF